MIKSINQAINLSTQLANTIVSAAVVVAAIYDDVVIVCVFRVVLCLSNASTMTPAIRMIIPAMTRRAPAIIPINELVLHHQ
jgi:hypothetical protein